MARVTLRAPAKINFFLEVLKKRPDGYHDIETILQEISLADSVTLNEMRSPGIKIQCSNPLVPSDSRNLAYKAAFLLKQYLREEKRGVVIAIEKNIPVAAGLGGGSSDAAAVLKGLNKLWKINLKTPELIALAEKIGMDVPFFILGGLCLGRGRGEKLMPLPRLPEMWFAVAVPDIRVQTAWVYSQLSISSLTRKRKKNRIILQVIQSSDAGKIGSQLFNRLEEVTMKKHRVIGNLKEKMLTAGAGGALMSGSGPAVFGLFPMREGACRMRGILRNEEEVYVAKNG